MNDIMKIVQALADSNTLLKGVTKTIEKEIKEQKEGFLSMWLDILGASLLGNLLSGKGIVRAGSGNKKGKRIVRAGTGNKKGKGIVRAGTGKQWNFSSFNKLWNTAILWEWTKIYWSLSKR